MYVIGVSETDFIHVYKRMSLNVKTQQYHSEIKSVVCKRGINCASTYSDYEKAAKALREIKDRKEHISFGKDSYGSYILNPIKDFDVDGLKVYRLVPHVCE